MVPRAWLVRSPLDFKKTMGGHLYDWHILPSLDPRIEPLVRRTAENIFKDLVDISLDEEGLVASYLDGIEPELEVLDEMGFMIFALETSGTWHSEGPLGKVAVPNMKRVTYLITVKNSYFRIGREIAPEHLVHRFDANCEAAVREIASALGKQETIGSFYSKNAVLTAHEQNVPWCQQCCLNEQLG